jgi:hypothetical protein
MASSLHQHNVIYVRWLQRFFAGSGGDPRLAWEDAQRAFVEQLEREWVPEWQVGQAARAVELYQKHTLSLPARTGWGRAGRRPSAGLLGKARNAGCGPE